MRDGGLARRDSQTVKSESSELLGEIRANGTESWNRLVKLYAPLVLHWCRRRGLQWADAEDVIQEVFVTVAARVGEFRQSRPGAFHAWLRVITQHKLGDLTRSRQKALLSLDGNLDQNHVPPHSVADPAERAQDAHIVYACVVEMARLEFEERTWNAFYRVVVTEESPQEVAAALGMTLNAVYLAKSRILRWARAVLRGSATTLDM